MSGTTTTGDPRRETDPRDVSACQGCGACCAHSHTWPRFSLETDAEIAAIPADWVATSGMRCEGERCAALAGRIGEAVTCRVYAVRPIVCRDCLPGDDACQMARAGAGMKPWRPGAFP